MYMYTLHTQTQSTHKHMQRPPSVDDPGVVEGGSLGSGYAAVGVSRVVHETEKGAI